MASMAKLAIFQNTLCGIRVNNLKGEMHKLVLQFVFLSGPPSCVYWIKLMKIRKANFL